MLGTLFTLPDATTFLSAVGSTSSPIVSDFIPFIELVLGIAFGIFVVVLISRLFHPSHAK